MAMVGAALDEEEIRRLKREAAIRQKDEEYKRKRVEDEERKRKQLATLKEEEEAKEKKKKEERASMMRTQAKIRAQRKEEDRRLNERREQRQELRENAWRKKSNAEIQNIVNDYITEQDHEAEVLDKARARKHAAKQKERDKKAQAELVQEEIEIKREVAIGEKESKRMIREAMRTDAIKEEAQEELLSFIQNPAPVPLKQVLCGRLRPVPTTTELLAAHRDAKEEFEELKEQDFEMRAVVRRQSLFQYVHDIQTKAEESRVRPPEPVAGDLMKKSTRSPKSPGKSGKKSMGRSGGTQSPSSTSRGRFARHAP